jgi:hypothetical protein
MAPALLQGNVAKGAFMAKRPERPAQQDERDREIEETQDESTFGRGADDVRSIADDEDEDEFEEEEVEELDEDEEEGRR